MRSITTLIKRDGNNCDRVLALLYLPVQKTSLVQVKLGRKKLICFISRRSLQKIVLTSIFLKRIHLLVRKSHNCRPLCSPFYLCKTIPYSHRSYSFCRLVCLVLMAMTGLSFSWEWAGKLFAVPPVVAILFGGLAIVLFAVLTVAYLLKWMKYPALVKTEFDHPVSISFFGTFIISLLLLPGLILPYSTNLAVCTWCVSAVLMFVFTLFVLRKWLDHQQEAGSAMPAWIIPVVGTLDVPVVGYRLPITGIHEICIAFFSIGLIFTLILMPIIISRLLFQPALPETLQPTLLILIGPFALTFSVYESLTGVQDLVASIFFYFDLFLLLLLGSKILLLGRCCPFRVTWWAVGFPLVAITIASFRFALQKSNPVFRIIPGTLLAVSTATILYLLAQSIYRLATRQFLLPKSAEQTMRIQPA